MNVNQIKKRLHPLAAKIPMIIWHGAFNGGEGSYDFAMAEKPLHALSKADFNMDPAQAFVTLAICHPKQNAVDRIRFAREYMQLSDHQIFCFSAMLGELDTCIHLKNNMSVDALITELKTQDYFPFRAAADSGHTLMCAWIKNQMTPRQFGAMNKAQHYFAFSQAFANGHLETCQWLQQQVSEKVFAKMLASKLFPEAFFEALKNGYCAVIQWLKKSAPETFTTLVATPQFRDSFYPAMSSALFMGNLNALTELEQGFPVVFIETMAQDQEYLFSSAVQSQGMKSLNWLQKRDALHLKNLIFSHSFKWAAEQGSIRKLRWLKKHGNHDCIIHQERYLYDALIAAAENGYFHVLKWLQRQAPQYLISMITAQDYRAFTSVCAGNNIAICEWMKQKVTADEYCEMTMVEKLYFPFLSAASKCDIEMCEWIKSQMRADEIPKLFELNKPREPDLNSMLYVTLRNVLWNKNLRVFEWLRAQIPNEIYQEVMDEDVGQLKRLINDLTQTQPINVSASGHGFFNCPPSLAQPLVLSQSIELTADLPRCEIVLG